MERTDRNLRRAVIWGFLAEALRRPGDSPFSTASELPEAAARLGLEVRPLLEALERAGDLPAAFDRTFGHTVRGSCPAYEGEYGGPKGLRYAHVIGDLCGYYRAFGLRPAAAAHERPDHVAVECEFFGFLAVKQACAAELHGEQQIDICRQAARGFLEKHLGRFGRALGARLRIHSPEPFYRELGGLLEQAIVRDGAELGVDVGSRDLALREDAGVPEDACVQCCQPGPEAPR